MSTRRLFSFSGLVLSLFLMGSSVWLSAADPLPLVDDVEMQPFTAQVKRLIEAADLLGVPLAREDRTALEAAMASDEHEEALEKMQTILDRYCLLAVNINPESRVKVAQGTARPELVQNGWRVFLVKVHNEAGVTAELQAVSPNAKAAFSGGSVSTPSDRYFRSEPKQKDIWLAIEMFNSQPLNKNLSGLNLEYRIIQLYSRDAGKREAKFQFNVGQGTQDLGFRNEKDILFTSQPAREIKLGVLDENDEHTTASFLIRDRQGHVYPAQTKRLAPDFGFHPQVYREHGESILLPDGKYNIEFSRGPESITHHRAVEVTKATKQLDFKVERWIDPSKMGWWSGDHHIHAAGCAHYTKPTEGVHAPDMMRHCLGEDVKIGANLTWGPCFDYQKQFFTGAIDKVSKYPYLLRYDVEVSGFGSHESGHLVLLRLKDQMYPGGDSKDHWPKLGLNTLAWAKKQGAVVGPAHSGWGLEVRTAELPNYVIPPFNGIGANEYIMDVTHEVPGPDGKPTPAVDFISTVDTPYVWELNIWYHTLNVGFRTRISGETDFPCIYGEKVGLGRSYVKLDGKLDYDQWCEGIRQGRNYVGDGKSHIIDFKVNETFMGEKGSEVRLSAAGKVRVAAKVAARLAEQPDPSMKGRPYQEKPYWDIERARLGDSREVPVELIVNGLPVARKNIVADGRQQDLEFDVEIGQSSWVALRVLPSSHTNPIFVVVDGKPIRASRKSAEWCLKGVDQCWSQKERFLKGEEKEQGKRAYEHARNVYAARLAESTVD